MTRLCHTVRFCIKNKVYHWRPIIPTTRGEDTFKTVKGGFERFGLIAPQSRLSRHRWSPHSAAQSPPTAGHSRSSAALPRARPLLLGPGPGLDLADLQRLFAADLWGEELLKRWTGGQAAVERTGLGCGKCAGTSVKGALRARVGLRLQFVCCV